MRCHSSQGVKRFRTDGRGMLTSAPVPRAVVASGWLPWGRWFPVFCRLKCLCGSLHVRPRSSSWHTPSEGHVPGSERPRVQKQDSGRDDTANADTLEMLRKKGADKVAGACHNCDALSHEVWQSAVTGVLHLQKHAESHMVWEGLFKVTKQASE